MKINIIIIITVIDQISVDVKMEERVYQMSEAVYVPSGILESDVNFVSKHIQTFRQT